MLRLLQECISLIIVESRLTDVQAEFPEVDVEYLSENDPSGSNKYLRWMAKQYVANKHKMRIEKRITDAVKQFHKSIPLLKKKDINAYATLDELTTALALAPEATKTATKKLAKVEGAEVIYTDDDVNIYYIKSKAACQQYGRGTKWCITTDSDAPEEQHWESYTNSGILFYYIIRKEPKLDRFDKVAVAYSTDAGRTGDPEPYEIYDAVDKKINFYDLDEVFSSEKEAGEAIRAIESDVSKRETPLDKFKKEYGYNDNPIEFLANLPEDATHKHPNLNDFIEYIVQQEHLKGGHYSLTNKEREALLNSENSVVFQYAYSS